jgi:hypothetical protein
MSVLKLTLLVDFQHKVGELVLYITSCPLSIVLKKYFKIAYRKCGYGKLTTGIMFLIFTCMQFWVWGSLSATAESLRNTVSGGHGTGDTYLNIQKCCLMQLRYLF